MPKYTVMWEVDLEADNPGHAAAKALTIQRDPNSLHTDFMVLALDPEYADEDGIVSVDTTPRNNGRTH